MSTQINLSKRIAIKNECVTITPNVNSINFEGSGINATTSGNDVTVTVPGSYGSTIFYLNESVPQAPYKEFSAVITTAVEQVIPFTVAGGGTTTIASYQTPSGVPGTTLIPGGFWQFYLHFNATTAGQNWIIRPYVYKRDLGGIETLILTSDPFVVTNMSTTTVQYTSDAVLSSTSLLVTDRLVVKIDMQNTSGVSQTANFRTEGSTHYSVVANTLNQNVAIPAPGIIVLGSGTCSTMRCGVSNTATNACSAALSGSSNTTAGAGAVIAGGMNNTACGACSSITGGQTNQATGSFSAIGGGVNHLSSGVTSSISGGNLNTASGNSSSVGGGISNTASGAGSRTGGGGCNTSSGNYSSILGGNCNITSGLRSTNGGGFKNLNNTIDGFIGGGNCNNVCNSTSGCLSYGSVVVGGVGNNTTGGTWTLASCCFTVAPTICNAGQYSFVGGGFQNRATSNNAVVNGGSQNTSSNSNTTIGGGFNNQASGGFATIGGGLCNVASGCVATISGGWSNTASGDTSFIGGGCANSLSNAFSSSIVGGICNSMSITQYSTIGGGQSNIIQSFRDFRDTCGGFIGGGTNNCISVTSDSTCSFYNGRDTIAGGYNNRICGTTSYYLTEGFNFIGGGINNFIGANSESSTISGGYANCSLCCGGTISGGGANKVLAQHGSIGGGVSHTISGNCSTISGGSQNTSSGALSLVGGGFLNVSSGSASIVGGGGQNTSSGYSSVIVGGNKNLNNSINGFIGGGNCNNVCNSTSGCLSYGAVVVGGVGNNTTGGTWDLANCTFSVNPTRCNAGQYSFIGGGFQNLATACSSTIVGGCCNRICINNTRSTIVGGFKNSILDSFDGFIGGGLCNNICNGASCGVFSYGAVVVGGVGGNTTGGVFSFFSCCFTTAPTIRSAGVASFVGGGLQNTASNTYAVVVGGINNVSCSTNTAIVGGSSNTATRSSTFIGGGILNTSSAIYATVVGGNTNTASGAYSGILGGRNNIASNLRTFIVGSDITSDRDCATFVNNLSIKNIPTSSAGLPSGSVWRNGSVLNIV